MTGPLPDPPTPPDADLSGELVPHAMLVEMAAPHGVDEAGVVNVLVALGWIRLGDGWMQKQPVALEGLLE